MRSDARSGVSNERLRDALLVALAAAAGVVDAICLVVLGVFTAAVTANLVLIGIAVGDADPHTAVRAALAFAGFAVGVLVAERGLRGDAGDVALARAPLAFAGIAALQLAFAVGWLASGGHPAGVGLDLLAVASALAMGAQTVAARSWHTGIPTTYVSGTLTVLLAELAVAAGSPAERLRRAGVIAAVAAGATIGAVLLDHLRDPVALLPLALTLTVAAGAATLRRAPAG